MSGTATISRTNFSNDTLTGSTADDTVSLIGTGSNVYVTLLAGNDALLVDESDDGNVGYTELTVMGGADNDSISGVGSDSLILANTGNDILLLNSQNARNITVFGGQGDDIFAGSDDFVDVEGGFLTTPVQGGDLLLFGNIGQELINISDAVGSNSVFGGQDSDTIIGSDAGNDLLSGDLGSDVIVMGQGNSSIALGGQGNDVFFVQTVEGDEEGEVDAVSGSLIFGGRNNDSVFGFDGDAALFDDGAVFGNIGTDYLYIDGESTGTSVFGGQDNDIIIATGDNGMDSVPGDLGEDGSVGGGDDTDSMEGVAATNTGDLYLSGDRGNDLIVANGAEVTMNGGQDSDLFNVTGTGRDDDDQLLIADFETGSDRISFGGNVGVDVADAGDNGNYLEVFVNASGYDSAAAAADAANTEYVFVQTQDTAYLFYNGEDDGDVQGVVELNGLTLDDFQASDIVGTPLPAGPVVPGLPDLGD